ncbi:MAG TPA: hypothetical protein VJ984_07725 [Xanthomonadales bacterium]|nr:hypothetical protein [Xanthomonadales bacterium]
MSSAKRWPAVLAILTLCILIPGRGIASENIVSSHNVAIDPNAPFPSVMYSDILKSMSDQVFWEKGQLRFFERVRLTFLPDFNDPQNIAAYNPDTGAFIVTELKDESGGEARNIFWEARQESFPYWNANVRNNSDPAPLKAGKYIVTWKIDGTPFWKLPFEVTSQPAANAYDQPNMYLEGPWQEWAYLYVPNGNLSQNPTFNFFLRDTDAKPGNWVEKNITLELKRNGTLVAQYGKEGATRQMAKPWWEAFEFALRNPDDSGFVSAADIVAEGEYTLTLLNNGEVYAEYSYEANGEIPFTGRQDRESADPMTYLEGARDRFFIKRQ